ncbi:polysaccharide biosynthesis tyrosine autokinase [Oscillatoria sp. FACHB-1406]|uniref:polysaccharide biosynthesis tyrosine autokinase n=1 Tax=Oscillatoria sp. FACHB-1406 TaxID=2692846 RepID=UPI001689A5CB|nr:polysaccharide biosynthesis tyrosine autokinase [Oscillatoria sp. FACHB-1406]MBD2578980.1 AAA family ATPase [Oscillatoria sp. FACHB-1406]
MTSPLVKRFTVSFDENKLIALISFALVVGAGGALSMLPPPPPTPPKYEAAGKLRFSVPPPTFTQTGQALQQQGQQVAISPDTLLSPQVLKPVSDKTQMKPDELKEKVEIKFPDKKDGGKDAAKDTKKKGDAAAPQEPFEFEVKYEKAAKSDTSKDKLEAAKSAVSIVDLLMQEMVKQSRAINTALLRTKIDALKERLVQAQGDQQAVEKAYYQFISQQGAAMASAEDGTLFAGISASQQQQRQVQLTLEGVQAQIASISSQLGMNPDQAYTSSMLSADPILSSLRSKLLEIEMQMEPLRLKLRPEHPQIQTLLEQKQSTERLLQERYTELMGTGVLTPLPGQIRKESSLDPARQQLANNLVTLRTQRDTLISQLQSLQRQEQQMKQQYERYPSNQLEKSRLQQQLQLKQTLYNNMLSSLVDAQSAEAETTGSLTVSQPPAVTETPAVVKGGINPLLAIGGGTVAGLIVASGIIFAFSFLDGRVHTVKEIQGILSDRDVTLLGELPLVFNLNQQGEASPILQPYNQEDLHFYELFRSNLRRSGAKGAKTIMITSEMGNEGKTVTAYNLAIASAQAGKRTLLIEADLRSPSVARSLGIEPDPDAQLEPLSYYNARSNYLQLAPNIANLYIVPGVGPQLKAAAVLESSEFKRLLDDAKGRFDLVIVDSPPLSGYNDAMLLEPLVEGIVIVARPGVTLKAPFSARLDRFVEAELPLLGVVINGVDDSELVEMPAEASETAVLLSETPKLRATKKRRSLKESQKAEDLPDLDAEEEEDEEEEEELSQQVASRS